jgi:ribosome-associated protein YbcJ (S4-like RNA binding protein)
MRIRTGGCPKELRDEGEIVSYDRAVKKRRRGKIVKYDAVMVRVWQ